MCTAAKRFDRTGPGLSEARFIDDSSIEIRGSKKIDNVLVQCRKTGHNITFCPPRCPSKVARIKLSGWRAPLWRCLYPISRSPLLEGRHSVDGVYPRQLELSVTKSFVGKKCADNLSVSLIAFPFPGNDDDWVDSNRISSITVSIPKKTSHTQWQKEFSLT